MEDIKIIEYKKMDLSKSMLVVAFPTVGLVSSIAGRYIIDSLELEYIGEISSRFFIPATVILKGVPRPPVRIYAGKKTCGENGACDQIVVVISEFMPPLGLIKPLSNAIMNWSERKGCSVIVTLEGLHTSDTKKPGVYGVSTTPRTKRMLEQLNIESIQEGMITGDSGVFLYEGARLQKDVICLLADAHASYPDSRAAGMLLEILDKLLPGIKIDPEPLYREADEIEKRIRKFLEQSKPTAPSITHLPSGMYG